MYTKDVKYCKILEKPKATLVPTSDALERVRSVEGTLSRRHDKYTTYIITRVRVRQLEWSVVDKGTARYYNISLEEKAQA